MCFGGGSSKSNGTAPPADGPKTTGGTPDTQRQQGLAKPTAGAQSMGLTVDDPNKKSVLGSY